MNYDLIYKNLRSDCIRIFYFGDPNWDKETFCNAILIYGNLPKEYKDKAELILENI